MSQIDCLGDGFRARTLRMRPDSEGDVTATLVRYLPDSDAAPAGRPAMLYVHGFVDYFFQTHLARAANGAGFDFYAIDLRKYGRSLSPHQTPNYCRSLREYDEDLDRAIAVIQADGHDKIVAMGHSTGGLIVPLWANDRPGLLDAVVLNSPWLELNENWLTKRVLTPVVRLIAHVAPKLPLRRLDPAYGEFLHVSGGGEWDYDLAWKPYENAFPVRAAWFAAIRRGHARVAKGLAVDCPILLCCSTESGPNAGWHDKIDRTDSVLNVQDMVERGPLLGDDVTIDQIPGGIHDLALSPSPARETYLHDVFEWLSARGLGAPLPDDDADS